MKLVRIESLSELRHCAHAWDDLWWRSSSRMPTHRANLVAQWVEHFAPHDPFVALAVEDDGQLVAALPLHRERKAGLAIGSRTANSWSDSGGLLVDDQCDAQKALRSLHKGIRALRWPLLLFDGVDLDDPAWQTWCEVQQENGAPLVSKPKFRIGQIDILHDWDAYMAAWSANHRRSIKKLQQKATAEGPVELVTHANLTSEEVEHHLHQAFEIEDKSWKGKAGSSVLRTPGAFDFFLRQAQQLAQWGQFELYFLRLGDQLIAFDYCYWAKGAVGSHKIGYDEAFRQNGPFQLLRSYQLEAFHTDHERRVLDTLGILGEANTKWSTRYVQSSRVMASGGTLLGRAALSGYEKAWPHVRRWLGRAEEPITDVEPGSARLLKNAPREQLERTSLATA